MKPDAIFRRHFAILLGIDGFIHTCDNLTHVTLLTTVNHLLQVMPVPQRFLQSGDGRKFWWIASFNRLKPDLWGFK